MEATVKQLTNAKTAAVQTTTEQLQKRFDDELQASLDSLETRHRAALHEALKECVVLAMWSGFFSCVPLVLAGWCVHVLMC